MRVKEVEKWFGRVLGRNKERGIGEMFKMNVGGGGVVRCVSKRWWEAKFSPQGFEPWHHA